MIAGDDVVDIRQSDEMISITMDQLRALVTDVIYLSSPPPPRPPRVDPPRHEPERESGWLDFALVCLTIASVFTCVLLILTDRD